MSQYVDAYNKSAVANHVRQAAKLLRSPDLPAQHAAIREYQMAADKLLALIYVRYGRHGLVHANIGAITLPERCQAVAAQLEREGKCDWRINAECLTTLMRSYGGLKHHVLPCVAEPRGVLSAGCSVVPALFEYYFGIELYDDCGANCIKEFPNEGHPNGIGCVFSSMEEDEAQAFVTAQIMSRISPLMTEVESEIFGLLDQWLIAGVLDSASIRRPDTFDQWYAFLDPGRERFWRGIPEEASADLDSAFDAKAMQVLRDLKTFIRTEGWSMRARSGPSADSRSDEELALQSVLNRVAHWLRQNKDAA